jgi:hypothetical protein
VNFIIFTSFPFLQVPYIILGVSVIGTLAKACIDEKKNTEQPNLKNIFPIESSRQGSQDHRNVQPLPGK